MKNSILVAVIAAATMLTACGSKKDSPADAPKATALTKSTQDNMKKGLWLGSCDSHQVGPHSYKGSEKVQLEFRDKYVQVSKLIFPEANCVGDFQTEPTILLAYNGTELSGKVTMTMNYTRTTEANNTDKDMTLVEGGLLGVYSMTFKDASTLVIKAKADYLSLNDTYIRVPSMEVLEGMRADRTSYDVQRSDVPQADDGRYDHNL